MPVKLLSNLPVGDLTDETDYLGIIKKGDRIQKFLLNNKTQFKEIKMFSLYGEWGSGKSSLMQYIIKSLKTHKEFKCFFFEAWEFEKDENLAFSLLEFLIKKSPDPGEDLAKDLLDLGGRILRGLAKSVDFKVKIPVVGEVGVKPGELVKEFEKEKDKSFFEILEEFKKKFRKFEDNITGDHKPDYYLIFIDDLDRCEPEQVLNLLSAIKLFFTYGQKTIFFCGIDKKAVEEAVKTKYGEVVLANEYLEKIFDISFSMPEYVDLNKMVNHYFNQTVYSVSNIQKPISDWISDFFKYIEFTNPRRVKKVLNKFQMLRNIKESDNDPEFPNIDEYNDSEQSYFETILVLYLIILHEFYPEYFNGFVNPNVKKTSYHYALKITNPNEETNALQKLNKMILSGFPLKKLNELAIASTTIAKFNICFAPSSIERFTLDSFNDIGHVDEIVIKDNKIEYLFYRYTVIGTFSSLYKNNCSAASLMSIKKLIKDAL